MTKNKQKGFTIIELLVVVAIIAVLAAIVLVNVTGYINQGKNAAVKGNMSTMLTNAAVYYDDNGNYTSFGTDAGYTAPAAAAATANGGTALTYGLDTTSNTEWCSCSVLKVTSAEITGSTFCVDSSGFKGVTQTACVDRCTDGAGDPNGACQP